MTHSKKLPQIGRQLLCILVAAAAASGFAHAQQPSYRIATEGTYPPWSFKNAEGQLQGWDVDIANALCEKMKARCEVVAQDWDGIIPGLVARKFDGYEGRAPAPRNATLHVLAGVRHQGQIREIRGGTACRLLGCDVRREACLQDEPQRMGCVSIRRSTERPLP